MVATEPTPEDLPTQKSADVISGSSSMEAKIDQAFETLEIKTPEGPKRIEGDVASIVAEAIKLLKSS